MEPVASRAVFLSYASQDVEPARRIAEALRAFGVEVWFDQSELRGGDAWDQKIRKQIHECALFLPIISATTQERGEGYFRREWKLAVERTHDMAEGVPFLVPVAIDDTSDADASVPEPFLRVQWTRLPGALPSPQFVKQVKRLLALPHKPAAGGVRRTESGGQRTEDRGQVSAGRKIGALAWGALAVVGLAGIAVAFWVTRKSELAAPLKLGAEVAPKPAAPVVNDKSIAVLPFKNLSDEKGTGYFADGVQEDILTNVQNVRELRVVSRQSVEQYRTTDKTMPQIGRELGVTYLVEGSVRKAGNRVHVTGQLIRAATDEHVWANSYDRDLSDIFAIQSEIAKAVAGELKAALSPQEKALIERRPTENLTAYDLYVKARDSLNREGLGLAALQKREALLESAVTLDANFVEAWVDLAYTHGLLYRNNHEHTPLRLAKARAAVEKAVRLDRDSPEVIRGLGDFYLLGERDYARAAEQYGKFARLQPNNAMAYYALGNVARREGRWSDFVENYRKGTQLDPGNVVIAGELENQLTRCRRYDEAAAERRRFMALNDNADRLADGFRLGLLAFAARGSTKEMDDFLASQTREEAESRNGIERRKTWASAHGDFAEAVRLDRLQPYTSGEPLVQSQQTRLAATTLAAAGDLPAARARLGNLPAELRARLELDPDNAVLWSELGMMEAVLGHAEEALRCAGKALEILPESRDAYDGPRYASALAFVYAWTGDKDRAIAEYARLLRGVDEAGFNLNVHFLRHGPRAFSLRGDPRWEALLNDPKNNAPLF